MVSLMLFSILKKWCFPCALFQDLLGTIKVYDCTHWLRNEFEYILYWLIFSFFRTGTSTSLQPPKSLTLLRDLKSEQSCGSEEAAEISLRLSTCRNQQMSRFFINNKAMHITSFCKSTCLIWKMQTVIQ